MNVAQQTLAERKAQGVLDKLRAKLADLKAVSAVKSDAETQYKDLAADIIPELRELGGGDNGPGVRLEWGGKEWAAFVCQPEPEQTWDAAPLIEWLKENGHWATVSTTVLDPQKLETEMAAGNIDRRKLAKFIVKTPRKPYVKWGNPKPDSK